MSDADTGASACASIGHGSGDAASFRAADWLGLAAAPTFALMASLTGVLGDGSMDMLCSAAHGASPLGGMALMYGLMSVFHLAPWLKWITRHRRGIQCSGRCDCVRATPTRAGAGDDRTRRREFGPAPEQEHALDIDNRSDTTLDSISDSNQPVRSSWRFVAADRVARLGESWLTRSNLRQDVPPNAGRRARLMVDAPAEAGRHALEVTMVQENVAWFHYKGMAITRSADVIEVSRDGEVGICH